MPAPLRITALASLATVGVLGSALAAEAAVNGIRSTSIASPPMANAPSDNMAFSQDNRIARLMAYDTAATNIVAGDSNGRRDVVVAQREGGSPAIASVARGGGAGNGDSRKPSLDGDTRSAPHCLAFESTSTDLAKGDSSADSDVFLRELRRGQTQLVSVGHSGARDAVVDGECEFVTYSARGKVFVRDIKRDTTTSVARGSNPDQQTSGKGVAYERGGQVFYQAFQRVFNKGKPKVKKIGREVIVSVGRAGRGNGVSRNPVMDDNGWYVAFESTATNLCASACKGVSADANGSTSDIFRRTLSRRAPSRDFMQMASFSFEGGEQGNGPSNNPSMTGAGENIAFDSTATNLRQSQSTMPVDPNGAVRDIYYWNFPRRRAFGNVSRESKPGRTGQFNGASFNPGVSNRSNWIGFTSQATGDSGEVNGGGIADVFVRFMGGGPVPANE